jgi:UDP-3-O-[3-hydroxymyristoyl] glucosamine N-acyltransferase
MSRIEFAILQRKNNPEIYKYNYPGHSFVHPSVIIPEWVRIGKEVVIHQGVVFGCQGFGFVKVDGRQLHIPHLGGVVLGDRVEIFDNAVITRGTVGDTVIGDDSKIDALVHVAHNVRIGKNFLVCSGSVLGGSCEFGNDVFIGSNSSVKDHVKIVDGVFVGVGSNVIKDIVEVGTVWAGNPAKFIRARRENE